MEGPPLKQARFNDTSDEGSSLNSDLVLRTTFGPMFTSVLVRGVGFEPTNPYGTGS